MTNDAEPLHRLRDAFLVSRNDLAQDSMVITPERPTHAGFAYPFASFLFYW
jgi:hypothetical protein